MRKLLFSIALVLMYLVKADCTGDSTRYLTPKDTIFLKVDDFGNKIFTHTMEKGQTLYSLSKFYGLKIYNLVAFNSHIEPEQGFSVGAPIKIPIPDSAILKTCLKPSPIEGYVPVEYVVKHGDTFYRIAKHFFHIPLDTLKRWNKLENTLIFSGMKLHVGYLDINGIPDSLQMAGNLIGSKMQALQQEFELKYFLDKPVFQNGAAYWQREKKSGSDYYCLHRSAPVGSVIRITNPMKKRVIYAKVIAPIPDRAYGDDIIIVLSPTIAKLLEARDPKFYVELSYFN